MPVIERSREEAPEAHSSSLRPVLGLGVNTWNFSRFSYVVVKTDAQNISLTSLDLNRRVNLNKGFCA